MWLTLALIGLAGCEARPPVTAVGKAEMGPREVLMALLAARERRMYAQVREHLGPEAADEVLAFVQAVDRLQDANAKLTRWLRENLGPGAAHDVDQGYLVADLRPYVGPDLAVFSTRVRVLDEAHLRDGTATVSYLVDDQLPVQRITFRQVQERWVFIPQSPGAPAFAEAFQELGTGLDLLQRELATGQLARSDLQRNPDLLLEKVRARLRRGVQLLSTAEARSRTALPPAGAAEQP